MNDKLLFIIGLVRNEGYNAQGGIIDAFLSTFGFINFKQKLTEIYIFNQSNAGQCLKCLNNLHCAKVVGI
jgi:hypothetical protein